MLFVKSDDLKTGMRLAKPIYNKNGVMLYERNSKLTSQGIMSIHNFGLIGVYILEPAEPLPPMSEDDIEFERFQTMSIFTIKEVLDEVADKKEAKELYPFANQVIKRYGNLHHKINFVQNLRSAEDTPYKHALNTAILCALMSKRLKLEFKEQLDVVVAGILYDIGSLLVPVSLRKLAKDELSEEDKTKINTYHYAGYQMLSQDYNLDPSVKRNATLVCKELFDIKTDDEVVVTKRIPEVEILKVAAVYDNMTAMKYEEPPLSEITALRHLLAKENGFDQPAVRALVESINILNPGVAVELSNGDRGLVITEGPIDILRPFVLSFRDNQVLNLSDESARDIEIKDVMRTMDNRHVVARDMLQNYIGEEVHMGESNSKKHF